MTIGLLAGALGALGLSIPVGGGIGVGLASFQNRDRTQSILERVKTAGKRAFDRVKNAGKAVKNVVKKVPLALESAIARNLNLELITGKRNLPEKLGELRLSNEELQNKRFKESFAQKLKQIKGEFRDPVRLPVSERIKKAEGKFQRQNRSRIDFKKFVDKRDKEIFERIRRKEARLIRKKNV